MKVATLKVAYAGRVAVARGVPRAALRPPALAATLQECSRLIRPGFLGEFLGMDGQPQEAHPANWRGCRALEVGIGPWRHEHPAEAFRTCQFLTAGIPELGRLQLLHEPDGRRLPDWQETFSLAGPNAAILQALDTAEWTFYDGIAPGRFWLPPYVSCRRFTAAGDHSSGAEELPMGGQEAIFGSGEQECRLFWD